MKIGQYNRLHVARRVDFGVYLSDENGAEVLLPAKYVTPGLGIGDEIEVFVYNDSEDRPVATTEKPAASVGEFAFLKVNAVNKTGAFLDWGLEKDLFLPFKQNEDRRRISGICLSG